MYKTIFTWADWLPNIRLVEANCTSAVIKTNCPKLSAARSIEFSVFYKNGDKNVGLSNIIRKCKNDESVKATFLLDCQRLYAVNISLSPIFPGAKCSEYCEYVEHTSNMWWLGDNCKNETRTNCINNKYITNFNRCPASSTMCSNLSTPEQQQNPKPKYSDWNPNIRLVNAFCSNLTVTARCPNFDESRSMEFSLFIKGKDDILYTVVKNCRPNRSRELEVTFSIDCFNLYFIKVSLGIKTHPVICDEFCSKPQSSEIWLLGNTSCSNTNVEKCENLQYTTNLNMCSTTFDDCIKPNNYFILIICLSIISVILLLGFIIYKTPQITNYCFVKIWYHRANDNVLLTNGSEV